MKSILTLWSSLFTKISDRKTVSSLTVVLLTDIIITFENITALFNRGSILLRDRQGNRGTAGTDKI